MRPPAAIDRCFLRIPLLTVLAVAIGLLCGVVVQAQAQGKQKIGEVLPIEPPGGQRITEVDYRKVSPPSRFEVKPPKGAPNVVIVLLDQVGYADPATFGGPIRTPTLDRLAKEGLTYTNFHVNSLCSPSRISLLTGRNSHQASIAAVVDASTAYPGDTGRRPDSVATIGEVLRRWGYVTSYFGKSHEVPRSSTTSAGRSTAGRRAPGSTSSTATSRANSPRSPRI